MRSMDADMLRRKSDEVRNRLENLPEFASAKVIACYVARRDEVQTESIIRAAIDRGVRVLVPITDSKSGLLTFSELRDFGELMQGTFHVLEPKKEFIRPTPLDGAEVVVVPMVAWDDRGYRVGHGKGYFDKALTPLQKTISIGLALEAQRTDRIPNGEYDVPMRLIVTEARTLRFGGLGSSSGFSEAL